MRWRAFHSFGISSLAILLGLSAACTHQGSLSTIASDAKANITSGKTQTIDAAALLPKPGECPAPDPGCSGDYEPMMCIARELAGMSLAENERVIGWGTNTCLAKAHMTREACRTQRSPSLLADVECIPDTSDGACPPSPVICTTEFAPSTCQAEAYDEQKLTGEGLPAASGSNPCRASATLLLNACRRNLNPKLLQRISCHSSPKEMAPTVK